MREVCRPEKFRFVGVFVDCIIDRLKIDIGSQNRNIYKSATLQIRKVKMHGFFVYFPQTNEFSTFSS